MHEYPIEVEKGNESAVSVAVCSAAYLPGMTQILSYSRMIGLIVMPFSLSAAA